MSVKLKQSKPVIAQLKSARVAISQAREKAMAVTGKHSALENERDQLLSAISKLEKRDTLTDGEIHTLSIKRTRLSLLQPRIATQANPDGKEIAALVIILRQFRNVCHAAMLPYHRELNDKILDALRRFYRPQRLCDQLAQGTDAVASLSSFCSMARGMGHDPIAQAKTALDIIDSLLAGKNPWNRKF
jgi:hypothetical protein